jgi:hypothetical protein
MQELKRLQELAGVNVQSKVIVRESNELQEKAPPGMEDLVMKLKKEYPGNEEKAFATAWSIYNKKHGKAEESMEFENEEPESEADPEMEQWQTRFNELIDNFVDVQDALNTVEHEMEEAGLAPEKVEEIKYALLSDHVGTDEPYDMDSVQADADTLASVGWGTDEDYGDFGGHDGFEESAVEEDFDLTNGYDDINHARGNDYFPTGADSPVVRDTGPSGARQGDNPEQKRMQVSEVQKELVYNYRRFLNETK